MSALPPISVNDLISAMNARYQDGKKAGRQEVLAQVRSAANRLMHLYRIERYMGPTARDECRNAQAVIHELLRAARISLEDKPNAQ